MKASTLIYWILPLAVLAGGGLLLRGQGEPEATEEVVPVSWVENLNESIVNDLSSLPPMDAAVDSFMRFWGLHGVSMAIVRNDSLLYAKGYGMADDVTPVTPGTCFRIASVSKLLTAAGILRLQEEGLLSLESPVFGPAGILGEYDRYIKDENLFCITVEHLLRHEGGFSSRGGDPVFSPYTSRDALVKKQLGRYLAFEPGSTQEYSNFGYLLLSLIVEKVSGQTYEDYMQKQVFEPAGCHQIRIAGNYASDRLPGETRYYMQPDAEKCASFDGRFASVEKCYGGNNVTGSAGAGGWTASVVELSRLVCSIDGYGPVEDILEPYSVGIMTVHITDDHYGLGWNDCKENGEWTRSGSFSGTQALVKRYPDGECWILLSNTSAWRGSRFSRNISDLFLNLRSRFSGALPSRDLFRE